MLNQLKDAQTLDELLEIRHQIFPSSLGNLIELNHLHDQLILRVVEITLHSMQEKGFNSPPPFSFFVMGSAGREEQGLWSDQDHGLVYIGLENAYLYFKEFAMELTESLHHVGYEKCDGQVMSTNQKWSKSVEQWEHQLIQWTEQRDWESIRNILTFMDARSLTGEHHLIQKLKTVIWKQMKSNEDLLKRMSENTMFVKKPTNLLGQIIIERYGPYSGHFNLKENALVPYINAIRLLAMKEQIISSSTEERLKYICNQPKYETILPYLQAYRQLLTFRSNYFKKYPPKSYEESHYVRLDDLTSQEKQTLKDLLRKGKKLHSLAKKMIHNS